MTRPPKTNADRLAAKLLCGLLLVISLILAPTPARAFSLLGPFAPWMTHSLSYQDGGYSIGGPMLIGEGYRWNVPTVTYGFDQSFLDFFGSNGVAAVEQAIQILNDVPPASVIDPSTYPPYTTRTDAYAESRQLLDLKSMTLSLLLEQMGLASPNRFMFCLRDFTDTNHFTTIMRNFDPFTLQATNVVDQTPYSYYLYSRYFPAGFIADTIEQPATVGGVYGGTAVADRNLYNGYYYTGLTVDDVGGLRYLLSPANLALESLLPSVTGGGSNVNNFVITAIRPGVDKITFVRLANDAQSGNFIGITNQYTDSYVTNNAIHQQTVRRVITRPDILFTVQDLGLPYYTRSGTDGWARNALPLHDGPGVIEPQVTITFNRLSPGLYSGSLQSPYNPSTFIPLPCWGSFDSDPNLPTIYGLAFPNGQTTRFEYWLFLYSPPNSDQLVLHTTSNLKGPAGATFLFQTSANLTDWVNILSITNQGGTFTFEDFAHPGDQQRFFRTIPQ